MKIGKLEQHCGDCAIIEHCCEDGYAFCYDNRFANVDEDEFLKLVDKVDWSEFVDHPPCAGCEKDDCTGCDEHSDNLEVRAKYVAEKVADLLK